VEINVLEWARIINQQLNGIPSFLLTYYRFFKLNKSIFGTPVS
jgi:hypothetical protein